MTRKKEVENWMRSLQTSITTGLEKIDGQSQFIEDKWERSGGGGGITKVIENGRVIEKGGVNFSAVHGETPHKIGKSLGFENSNFFATGVSIVLHPINPWVPIIHMNVRYFEMTPESTSEKSTYWFGGGIDLTPHYIDPKDGGIFHQKLKSICEKTSLDFYPKFKNWADDYFFVKHRNETRGIGGIFFDQLNESSSKLPFRELWGFVQQVGESFLPIYGHFVEKYAEKPYTDQHQKWQMLRRGRYVEFNLVWDKGTKFGLDTEGRTESILMSLPKNASWEYNHLPTPESSEANTLKWLKKGIDWIDYA